MVVTELSRFACAYVCRAQDGQPPALGEASFFYSTVTTQPVIITVRYTIHLVLELLIYIVKYY